MRKSRFTNEQSIAIIAEVLRRHGISRETLNRRT